MSVIGLLSMPWADREKAHLWRQGFRIVTVVLLIAVSKPVIGVGVDAMNAVTMELAPQQFELSFDPSADQYGVEDVGGTFGLIAAYFVAAILMMIATPLAILGLVLRTYIIYIVFMGAPILAVFWYPDWGFGAHLNKFATKFGRMGIYSLVAGPLLAIALKAMKVIMDGGVVQASSGNGATEFWTQLVLIMMTPFVLVAIVLKSISWAGQPLGIGKAYSMVSTAAMAGAGAAAGAASGKGAIAGADAGGSAAGAVGGTGDAGSRGGGGSRGGSKTGRGSGAGGGSSGSTPRSVVDNGTLGDQIDGDVQSAGKDRPQSYIDDLAEKASGAKEKTASSIANNRGAEFFKNRGRELHNGITGRARKRHPANRAQQLRENADWLEEQVDAESVDLEEAHERDILEQEPAYDKQADVTKSGRIGYETSDGEWNLVNIETKQRKLDRGAKINATASHTAKKSAAATAASLKTGKTGAKATTKAAKPVLQYGAYGMGGYAPVMAHDRAKRKHQPNGEQRSQENVEKAVASNNTRKQTNSDTTNADNKNTMSYVDPEGL
jgi:type IV secretion system protein TrbL